MQTWALRFTSVLLGSCSILFMEQANFVMRSIVYKFNAYLPAYILGLMAIVSILLNRNYKPIQKGLLVVVLALFFLPLHLGHFYYVSKFLMSFISIGAFICMALFMITIDERRLFSIFINVVGIRFLVLYFQAFGGLAYTGFGLIISGVLMIAAVIFWKKNIKKMTDWIEGVMK